MLFGQVGGKRTDNKTTKEGINPTHDQSLGDNHGHVSLDHVHHLIHSTWIGHWVSGWLADAVGVFEEGAGGIGVYEVVFAGGERGEGDLVGVVSEVDSVEEVSSGILEVIVLEIV